MPRRAAPQDDGVEPPHEEIAALLHKMARRCRRSGDLLGAERAFAEALAEKYAQHGPDARNSDVAATLVRAPRS